MSANDLSSANGLFKKVYADKMEQLIPDGVKLLKKMKFSSNGRKPGESFQQPVILGHEHGMTFGSTSDDAFLLNAPISGNVVQAEVKGYPKVLRSAIGYTTLSRANGNEAAFKQATKYVVANMLRSFTKKQEIEALYGQMGYGTVASVAANVITITTGEYAPGIWAGAENMPLEIRDPAGVLRGECKVVSVSIANRSITVDALPSGTTASDVIYHKGAYGKEAPGLHKIASNTSSLFGIDASQYSLWTGNSFNASGALDFQKVQDAIALGASKGLEGDVCLMVNPKTWADLMDEQSALRQYDSSFSSSKMENGALGLKFGSQAGSIEIISSIYVKESYAHIFAEKDVARIGSSDVTFKLPDRGDEFFRHMENSAGVELRAWSDYTPFCQAPGRLITITGITN